MSIWKLIFLGTMLYGNMLQFWILMPAKARQTIRESTWGKFLINFIVLILGPMFIGSAKNFGTVIITLTAGFIAGCTALITKTTFKPSQWKWWQLFKNKINQEGENNG